MSVVHRRCVVSLCAVSILLSTHKLVLLDGWSALWVLPLCVLPDLACWLGSYWLFSCRCCRCSLRDADPVGRVRATLTCIGACLAVLATTIVLALNIGDHVSCVSVALT
jgi:hypothetical protein